MYDLLQGVSHRPALFSQYTVSDLWTRPHLAKQMLANHLDPQNDRASYRVDVIDQVVSWIDLKLKLSEKRVCDLGCGPGLYAERFAAIGAEVTGIDFSHHSVSHAKRELRKNKLSIQYLHSDYLKDNLPTGFDVVTLIFTDLCVFSPAQRQILLDRIRGMLNPGGRVVLDVVGVAAFSSKVEETQIEDRLMNGFWAEGQYVGIKRTFLYPEDWVSLDRYLIVEPSESWEIFNWFQYYTPASLEAELRSAGFYIDEMVGSLKGDPLENDSELIGVIASLPLAMDVR